jgi:hypothetical protein
MLSFLTWKSLDISGSEVRTWDLTFWPTTRRRSEPVSVVSQLLAVQSMAAANHGYGHRLATDLTYEHAGHRRWSCNLAHRQPSVATTAIRASAAGEGDRGQRSRGGGGGGAPGRGVLRYDILPKYKAILFCILISINKFLHSPCSKFYFPGYHKKFTFYL